MSGSSVESVAPTTLVIDNHDPFAYNLVRPVGVQFHPESILTDSGKQLAENVCFQCNTT